MSTNEMTMRNTYEIDGRKYTVTRHIEREASNVEKTSLPIVDIPMMSDETWQELCRKSREEHPEWYSNLHDI